MGARIFIEISNGSYYVEKLVKISWTGKIRADYFKTLIPQNPRHQIRRGHFMLIGHVTVTLSQNQNQRNYEEHNVDMIHNRVFWLHVHKCVCNHPHLKLQSEV